MPASAELNEFNEGRIIVRRGLGSQRLGRSLVMCRLVFSKRSQRKTGARLSGRTLRPNDDAVPPMEDIEDDCSGVLAAAEGG